MIKRQKKITQAEPILNAYGNDIGNRSVNGNKNGNAYGNDIGNRRFEWE